MIQRSTLNLRYDRLMIDYSDFRLLSRDTSLLIPGSGNALPLYRLDANIIQLFYSLYF